jgi:hypothetical protein
MKKGQVSLDIVTFGVILLIMSMSTFIGFIIMKEWKDTTDKVFTDPTAKNITAKSEVYFETWDKGMLFLIGGMGMALFISVFYVKTHPAYFFVSLISLIFALVFIPQLSNVFYGFQQTPIMLENNMSEKFPITIYIMNSLPFILAIMGIGYLIILFAKQFGGSSGGGDTNY